MSMKRRFASAAHDFFFAPVDAGGFRLMRAAWGATALAVMLPFFWRVPELFAEPRAAGQSILVHPHAWSLFFHVTAPASVTTAYAAFVAACVFMIAGVRPRESTMVAVFLFMSFAARNIAEFHTEATLLRLFGVILVLASLCPGGVNAPWGKGKGATIPAWPYRLLLWQVIVLYVATGWFKAVSPMWLEGWAVDDILHGGYSRLPPGTADALKPLSPFLTYATVAWELAWVLLLVPVRRLHVPLKRALILTGVVMHGSWAVLLNSDILPLSLAMFASYLGLLDPADRAWLKTLVPRNGRGRR
jgi:hypothetical protein